MIRYVWFDLGYTLVATNREEAYQKTLERFAVTKTIGEITIAYHQVDKLFMREYPGILGKDRRTFLPWYIGTLNYFLGISLSIEDLIRIHLELLKDQPVQWKAFDFTKPTLHCLKAAGYQLGLISNWDQSAREVLSRNDLEELFDEIIISSEVGVEKPNPAIFELALARGKVTAEQSLYVGDNYYDDVRGCRQVGIHCLLINPYNNLGIEELNYAPIIPNVQGVADYLGLKLIPQKII